MRSACGAYGHGQAHATGGFDPPMLPPGDAGRKCGRCKCDATHAGCHEGDTFINEDGGMSELNSRPVH